ncbi:hypothetical protein ABWJ92_36800 [Streptomyces sp. NPDC000609]|uniref:hypothetical protein n=1 Tax=Streptomyces sp. NPDC000609 TaxID=3160957 RepID=UPI00339B65D6
MPTPTAPRLSYFVTESHTEEGTRARVGAAAGLCPARTRRLLADASAPWPMPRVHDLALAGWTRLLDAPDARRARCPCRAAGDDATERASETQLLHDPVRADEYTHTHGIRLRHAVNRRGAREGPVHAVPAGRTALLRRETDEVLRKQNRRTRHEIEGAGRQVARRAPTLLDGRIHAGLPAPPQDVAPAPSDDVPKSRAPHARRKSWSST